MKLKDILLKLKNNKGYLKDLLIIKKSNYFDAKWYLATYKDVKQSNIDPAVHYLKYGWKEMRDPSPLFSTSQYLQANLDVKKANINPLVHFEKYGKKEKRRLFYNKILTNYLECNNIEKHKYDIISNSEVFDFKWYKSYYYFAIDPVIDYMKNTTNRNPSKIFYPKEYLIIYPDVAKRKADPFYHYEQHGKYENRAISLADLKSYIPPKNAIKTEKNILKRTSYNKHIIAVVALFSKNGKLEDYQIYLLENLKNISDYVVIVADNFILQEELSKLDNICNHYIFKRHGEYDFGSYKYGFKHLIDNNIFDTNDSLLFINDSNYGPIFSLENIICDYRNKKCDFYGLSIGREQDITYIQSFFYIFSYKVYSSKPFIQYINNIKPQLSFSGVILEYEYTFTEYLKNAGFTYNTYVDSNFIQTEKNIVPTLYAVSLLKQYNYPFIKRKTIQGKNYENHMDAIELIKEQNIDVYNMIINSNDYNYKPAQVSYNKPTSYNIYNNYSKKIQQISNKFNKNKAINIVFLVNMVSMFPAEQLMVLLKNNNKFDVSLYVIPDVRFGDKEMYRIYNDTYNELKNKYPYVKHAVHINKTNDTILEWYNVIKEADIVCYPSPYDVSFSLYNPYYAVQENILSIHINYGFFRSKYDRIIYNMDNYNNFWKVFLETEINFNEYKIYGQCEATNSVVVGYAKMDKLIDYIKNKKTRDRKRIVIAPHHSVDGGMNKALSLSNFEQYADLFLTLPQRYPDIDFIFRPHPVLFTVLRKSNKWGNEKVDNYLNEMKSFPNVTYSTEGDYLEIFANSDGIIQDSGSFLVEYFYTFKPCCYMLKSPNDINDKFNELGVKCLEHVYIAYDEIQITNFIDDVINNNNDYMKEDRIKFAKEEIMVNYPNVSEKIYDYLIEVLEGKND